MAEPTKLWLFNTGVSAKQDASTMYDSNKWYDFSEKKNGKLYYVFLSPPDFADTIFISMQNGELGSIIKYKLFVSSKQSADFDVNATFKPILADEFDEINYSELMYGINDPVTLVVTDENLYSKFDYEIGTQNVNEIQKYITHNDRKPELENLSIVPYNTWLAYDYGHITKTKSFKIVCTDSRDQNASSYLANTFNWVYSVKRISDGKTKSVTRKIRILDDRLKFVIDLVPGIANESTYQNQMTTMYQLKYQTPSISADDYTITVISNNEDAADVYLMNKDMSFRKTSFDIPEIPPASHNLDGSPLAANNSGLIQIKGKQPGKAVLTFTLRHKATGATATVTKTVTTIADPVKFVIEPAPTIDAMNVEHDAVPFGGIFHTYQNPRFKIRLSGNSEYPGNTQGEATVIFSTVPSIINVAQLTIFRETYYHTKVTYGEPVQLQYDVDYFITVTAPVDHPWNIPAGSLQFVNIKMCKATNQQTQIEAEYNNVVRYTLRPYQNPLYKITAEIYNEKVTNSSTQNAPTGANIDVYAAGVTIKPRGDRGVVEITKANGSFNIRNVMISTEETGDSNGGIIYPVSIPPMGTLNYEKYVGYTIELLPEYTVSDPDWNNKGAGVSVTTYQNLIVTVRDNWGCIHHVTVSFLPKIIYGW